MKSTHEVVLHVEELSGAGGGGGVGGTEVRVTK